MTPWSPLLDASDLTAEHAADMRAEHDGDWADDDERPDPWDIGPIHHPTRFDLPIPAEPPF